MNIKVAFVSLGCPKNLVDTEVMLARLIEEGFEIVPEDIAADVVIVNTCAFIQSAREEAIESILDIAWLKKNHTLKGIVVTGCLAANFSDDIEKSLPEVDAIVGIGSEGDICEAVRAAYRGEKYKKVEHAEKLPLGGDRVVTTPEYTAYLKISEGCDNRCAYCAIPNIRGKMRSRKMEDICDEAANLYELGAREICLVAQDTTAYGKDIYGRYALPQLLEKLCCDNRFNFKWIRLLYCYPDKISDELVEVMAKYDSIAKYIDMPIQHISDRILAAMNRHGDSSTVKDAIARLRCAMPNITIRTTLLVGFPGEKVSDFNELCDFVKEANFERLGVFAYSKEENTPAFDMTGQVSKKTAEKRVDILMTEQFTVHEKSNRAKIGKTIEVLCEGYDKVSESYFGRSEADAPEIDGKVYFSSKRKINEGCFVSVKITDCIDYDLVGETIL